MILQFQEVSEKLKDESGNAMCYAEELCEKWGILNKGMSIYSE